MSSHVVIPVLIAFAISHASCYSSNIFFGFPATFLWISEISAQNLRLVRWSICITVS